MSYRGQARREVLVLLSESYATLKRETHCMLMRLIDQSLGWIQPNVCAMNIDIWADVDIRSLAQYDILVLLY